MQNTLFRAYGGYFMPIVDTPTNMSNCCVIGNSGKLYLKKKIKVTNNMYLTLC